jgi:hypothetical protein
VRRPALADDFRAWQAARGAHGDEPVYLVAAAGGASRAAFWTGALLLELERQARSQGKRFAPNIYAMSGVSGGSLGLAAFAGSLAVPSPDYGATAGQVGAFLGQDYLAPLVGYLLYPDLLARFWPFPCRACDRSLALEGAWQRDWARFHRPVRRATGSRGRCWRSAPRPPALVRGCCSTPPPPATAGAWCRPISPSSRPRPTTCSPAAPATAPLDTSRLTLAQAVHNSARFPYISPAALVSDHRRRSLGLPGRRRLLRELGRGHPERDDRRRS